MPEQKTAKKTVRRPKKVVDEVVETESENFNLETGRKLPQFTRLQISILLALVLVGILYVLRSWFVVAFVNGQPIFRVSLIKDLENQYGKQAESNLITKALIYQEAKKKNVVVADNEVNDEIKKIETQLSQSGQSLDQALVAQGMTRANLVEQIKLQKIIEKLVGKDSTVTDADVDAYIEKNKSSFPEGQDMSQLRSSVKQQLQQQNQSQKVQNLLKQLQEQAKIFYIVQY